MKMSTKLKTLSISLGITMLTVACGGNEDKATQAAAATRSDSLYKEAIALHDEAMPRMGQLLGLQKTVKLEIDSLSTLTRDVNAGNSDIRLAELEQLNTRLDNAIFAMNDWMDHFDPDPVLADEAAKEAYFSKQAETARAMRDSVVIALDSANAYFKRLAAVRK